MNQTFDDVDTPELCNELHDHLFLKLQLLERVIRARKLHHSRFFSMNMDYGHQKFLDSLSSQRAIIAKLLERLAHRTSKVAFLYKFLPMALADMRDRCCTRISSGSNGSGDAKTKKKNTGRRSRRRLRWRLHSSDVIGKQPKHE